MEGGWGAQVPNRGGGGGDAIGQISNDLNRFTQSISMLKKMTGKLGGSKDTPSMRAELQQRRREAKQQSKQILGALQRNHAAAMRDPSQKVRYNKVRSAFQKALQEYQKVSNESVRKEKDIVVKMSASVRVSSPLQSVDTGGSYLGGGSQMQDVDSVDQRIIDERNTEILELERDLVELNEAFKDMAHLVNEQGESLNVVEGNIASAETNVSQGTQELSLASKYLNSARKKCACLIFIVLVILAIVLGVVLS